MLVLKLLSFMFDAFTFLPYFVCHLYGKIFVLRTLKVSMMHNVGILLYCNI